MAPLEALYVRRCRTPLCWSNMEEKRNLGLELVWEVEDKARLVCERLKAAPDRQKSYADLRCRDIENQVGDKVFLKVSLWKKVLRLGRKGKISPRSDPSHIVHVEEIEVQSDLSYEEELVVILDHEIKVLHNKTILLMKVL
ncbi:uncharacterized protein LOC128035492 [Gossypium raimondii]|uniref:uncharacterized protein LOC128035492 n=1 Tax=Gossypium raimondii TaxID=29730 RepID=UPI00227CAB87|nr:uncharacterized protein LOC128035492 [Gossypium raimondii]